MKQFKQLLCFIIPSFVCLVLYFLLSAINSGGEISFMGLKNYFRLFFEDKTFCVAFLNSIKIPLLIALCTVSIALALKVILKNKNPKNIFYYLFLGLTNVVVFQIYKYLFTLYYNSEPIYQKLNIKLEFSVTFQSLLLSFQLAIFACFLFWIGSLIIEKIKNRKTYQDISKDIKNYEWDINTDSLPKRTSRCKEFFGLNDELFVVTEDNKYGIFFYNIYEVSMCRYYSALAIFSADNLKEPLVDLKPVRQKRTGRIEGYKRYFYAPLSNCIIAVCNVNGELPFLLIKPTEKRFALIPFDYTSIYYSVNETEENKLVLEESSPNELKRLKEKGYKSKNGVQLTLHDLTWYNLTEFENIEEIYLNIKGELK